MAALAIVASRVATSLFAYISGRKFNKYSCSPPTIEGETYSNFKCTNLFEQFFGAYPIIIAVSLASGPSNLVEHWVSAEYFICISEQGLVPSEDGPEERERSGN